MWGWGVRGVWTHPVTTPDPLMTASPCLSSSGASGDIPPPPPTPPPSLRTVIAALSDLERLGGDVAVGGGGAAGDLDGIMVMVRPGYGDVLPRYGDVLPRPGGFKECIRSTTHPSPTTNRQTSTANRRPSQVRQGMKRAVGRRRGGGGAVMRRGGVDIVDEAGDVGGVAGCAAADGADSGGLGLFAAGSSSEVRIWI